MFLRFVVGTGVDNPYYLTGVLTYARDFRDAGRLGSESCERLNQLFDWFGDHLPCPPFSRNRRRWSQDAVCWFKSSAGEPLTRMWELVEILKNDGLPVRFVTSMTPGRIVYEDEHQIVARTPSEELQDARLVSRRRGGRRKR